MRSRSVRAGAVLVAVLSALALAGCGAGPERSGAEDACAPRYPTASEDRLRTGSPVTITVTAGTCTASFDRTDRRLVLTWVDAAGARTRLATARAYPSGAFEREVRVPRASSAGTGTLLVTGVAVPCSDTGSCAAYGAAITVVDTQPDFGRTANGAVAAAVAEHMQVALAHDPAVVQLAIVADGIEASLHSEDVDVATDRVQHALVAAVAAVPGADRRAAEAIRLQVRLLRHSGRQLRALSARILHDRDRLEAEGIAISGWGVDPSADAVTLTLRRYSDATAVRLVDRYGDALAVEPRSVVAIAA